MEPLPAAQIEWVHKLLFSFTSEKEACMLEKEILLFSPLKSENLLKVWYKPDTNFRKIIDWKQVKRMEEIFFGNWNKSLFKRKHQTNIITEVNYADVNVSSFTTYGRAQCEENVC